MIIRIPTRNVLYIIREYDFRMCFNFVKRINIDTLKFELTITVISG